MLRHPQIGLSWLLLAFAFCESTAQEHRPGIKVQVSTKFLNAGFAHPVDKTSSVDVFIKKYHVTGAAQLTGQMSYEPLSSENGIRLRMVLTGTAVGCDWAQLRRIQVHTIDRSRVCVQQEVLIDAGGVRALGGASVSAPTVSEFQTATAGKPPLRDALTRGLVKSQFRFMPAKTNRTATDVSEIVLRQQLDQDLPATIAAANERFRGQFLETLSAFEIPADHVRFRSTLDGVELSIAVPHANAAAFQPTQPSDLAMQIHESVLNRFAQQLFGGSTQIGKDLEQDLGRVLQLFGAAPPKAEPSAMPWTVTFAKDAPVTFRFADNSFQVTLRGDEFELGKEQHKAMTAVITFDVQQSSSGWRAVRRGAVRVSPPGAATGVKPTPRQQVIAGFLAARLGQIFGKEIELSRFTLPEALGQASQARLSRAAAENGWLTLELRLPQ